MNRKDVIRLANEAGMQVADGNSFADDMYVSVLYRFANLVEAEQSDKYKALAGELAEQKECKCSLRTALVGDGCEVCNPAQSLEYCRENLTETEAERDKYKALAGELAEALSIWMEAETNEAWRYPTVWGPIVRKARAAFAKYEQEKVV
jgi:hypothetical protein